MGTDTDERGTGADTDTAPRAAEEDGKDSGNDDSTRDVHARDEARIGAMDGDGDAEMQAATVEMKAATGSQASRSASVSAASGRTVEIRPGEYRASQSETSSDGTKVVVPSSGSGSQDLPAPVLVYEPPQSHASNSAISLSSSSASGDPRRTVQRDARSERKSERDEKEDGRRAEPATQVQAMRAAIKAQRDSGSSQGGGAVRGRGPGRGRDRGRGGGGRGQRGDYRAELRSVVERLGNEYSNVHEIGHTNAGTNNAAAEVEAHVHDVNEVVERLGDGSGRSGGLYGSTDEAIFDTREERTFGTDDHIVIIANVEKSKKLIRNLGYLRGILHRALRILPSHMEDFEYVWTDDQIQQRNLFDRAMRVVEVKFDHCLVMHFWNQQVPFSTVEQWVANFQPIQPRRTDGEHSRSVTQEREYFEGFNVFTRIFIYNRDVGFAAALTKAEQQFYGLFPNRVELHGINWEDLHAQNIRDALLYSYQVQTLHIDINESALTARVECASETQKSKLFEEWWRAGGRLTIGGSQTVIAAPPGADVTLERPKQCFGCWHPLSEGHDSRSCPGPRICRICAKERDLPEHGRDCPVRFDRSRWRCVRCKQYGHPADSPYCEENVKDWMAMLQRNVRELEALSLGIEFRTQRRREDEKMRARSREPASAAEMSAEVDDDAAADAGAIAVVQDRVSAMAIDVDMNEVVPHMDDDTLLSDAGMDRMSDTPLAVRVPRLTQEDLAGLQADERQWLERRARDGVLLRDPTVKLAMGLDAEQNQIITAIAREFTQRYSEGGYRADIQQLRDAIEGMLAKDIQVRLAVPTDALEKRMDELIAKKKAWPFLMTRRARAPAELRAAQQLRKESRLRGRERSETPVGVPPMRLAPVVGATEISPLRRPKTRSMTRLVERRRGMADGLWDASGGPVMASAALDDPNAATRLIEDAVKKNEKKNLAEIAFDEQDTSELTEESLGGDNSSDEDWTPMGAVKAKDWDKPKRKRGKRGGSRKRGGRKGKR